MRYPEGSKGLKSPFKCVCLLLYLLFIVRDYLCFNRLNHSTIHLGLLAMLERFNGNRYSTDVKIHSRIPYLSLVVKQKLNCIYGFNIFISYTFTMYTYLL
jgi:hypothetical protein